MWCRCCATSPRRSTRPGLPTAGARRSNATKPCGWALTGRRARPPASRFIPRFPSPSPSSRRKRGRPRRARPASRTGWRSIAALPSTSQSPHCFESRCFDSDRTTICWSGRFITSPSMDARCRSCSARSSPISRVIPPSSPPPRATATFSRGGPGLPGTGPKHSGNRNWETSIFHSPGRSIAAPPRTNLPIPINSSRTNCRCRQA